MAELESVTTDVSVFTGYGYEEDDGTMPDNVQQLAELVIGHKIVAADKTTRQGKWGDEKRTFKITLDNGRTVFMDDTNDCCAFTQLESFLLHPGQVDHVITGVRTEGGFTKWHIMADYRDVLELTVGWSCGNPFYYAYGFDIAVVEAG